MGAAGRGSMTLFVATRTVHVDGRDRNSGVSRLAGAGVPLGKYNQLEVNREVFRVEVSLGHPF